MATIRVLFINGFKNNKEKRKINENYTTNLLSATGYACVCPKQRRV